MTSTARHTISTHSGLIACAVNDLGFIPEQSLVLVCTPGARRRLVLVTRVDLPTTPSGLDTDLIDHLTGIVGQHADAVVAILFTTAPRRHTLVVRSSCLPSGPRGFPAFW